MKLALLIFVQSSPVDVLIMLNRYRFLTEYATCRPFCCRRIHIGCASFLQWMVSYNFIFAVYFVYLTLRKAAIVGYSHICLITCSCMTPLTPSTHWICLLVLGVNTTWWFLTFDCRVFSNKTWLYLDMFQFSTICCKP